MAGTNVGAVYLDLRLDIKELEKGFNLTNSMLGDVKTAFGNISGMVQRVFSAETFAPVFSGFEGLSERALGFGSSAAEMGRQMLEMPFRAVSESVRQLSGGINTLTSGARSFGTGFRTAFGAARREVTELGGAFARISGGISESWGSMLGGLSSGWDNAWTGIGRSFSGVVNRIIDGLNTMIGGINRISIDIPRWLGGGSLGFSVPSIPNVPRLARGGIVQAPTLAMVGERGREAVLPLENNTGWMVELASMMADAVVAGGGAGRGSGASKVVLQLDGKKLAEALVDDLEEVAVRRGVGA